MKQKIFLFLAFLFISFTFTSYCRAEEEKINYNLEYGKQCIEKHCMISIPTLRKPENDKYFVGQEIFLTGLTPNKTRISIYIDDLYQGEAVVNEDKSGTANFYFKLDENIKTGNHKWSAIAWSMTRWQRSFVSEEHTFTIEIKEKKVIDLSDANKEFISEENISTSTKEDLLKENSLISSTKEENIAKNDLEIKVDAKTQDKEVVINKDKETSVNVNINNQKEENMLVVDKSKSEISEKDDKTSEKLQGSKIDENLKQEILKETDAKTGILSKIYKLGKSKIMGMVLLILVMVVSFISLLFSRKK